MKKILFFIVTVVIVFGLLSSSSMALAQTATNSEDVQFSNGLDLEQVLYFGSGILALVLFTVTVTAYKRTKNPRLLSVSAAFLLCSLSGFLIASQLFFGDWAWIDPIASVINFIVLVCFFFGILRK